MHLIVERREDPRLPHGHVQEQSVDIGCQWHLAGPAHRGRGAKWSMVSPPPIAALRRASGGGRPGGRGIAMTVPEGTGEGRKVKERGPGCYGGCAGKGAVSLLRSPARVLGPLCLRHISEWYRGDWSSSTTGCGGARCTGGSHLKSAALAAQAPRSI